MGRVDLFDMNAVTFNEWLSQVFPDTGPTLRPPVVRRTSFLGIELHSNLILWCESQKECRS